MLSEFPMRFFRNWAKKGPKSPILLWKEKSCVVFFSKDWKILDELVQSVIYMTVVNGLGFAVKKDIGIFMYLFTGALDLFICPGCCTLNAFCKNYSVLSF